MLAETVGRVADAIHCKSTAVWRRFEIILFQPPESCSALPTLLCWEMSKSEMTKLGGRGKCSCRHLDFQG